MKNFKSRRNGMPPFIDPAFAEALAGEEDGQPRRQKSDYKALQLCRQVQRVLTLEFSGSADEILRDSTVADVTPAPDASHLLVHVAVPKRADMSDVLRRLDAVVPRLRAEVARAITRKRAPMLSFIPVPWPEAMS